jgi:peroxiredoxin
MAQLRRDYSAFLAQDAVILVIGPEGPASFKSYFERHDLPFIGLPDPSHKVLKLFGQQVKLFKWGRMPAQVLVDKQCFARFVHYGQSMSDIPDNAELIGLLAAIEPPDRGERDDRSKTDQQGGDNAQHAES